MLALDRKVGFFAKRSKDKGSAIVSTVRVILCTGASKHKFFGGTTTSSSSHALVRCLHKVIGVDRGGRSRCLQGGGFSDAVIVRLRRAEARRGRYIKIMFSIRATAGRVDHLFF